MREFGYGVFFAACGGCVLGYVWFARFASTTGRKTCFSHFFFFLLSAVKADFFNRKQCICALFMDPQISLFINFFIKNGSHDIIHTFKNYFVTMFFSFSFQFSIVYTEEYIFRINFFFFILEGNNILLMISW